jgi:hypothetical protein
VAARSTHQLLDSPPLILDDPAIVAVLGPADVERLLGDTGFRTVEFLTHSEAAARYFTDRADALLPPRRTTIVRAGVGDRAADRLEIRAPTANREWTARPSHAPRPTAPKPAGRVEIARSTPASCAWQVANPENTRG